MSLYSPNRRPVRRPPQWSKQHRAGPCKFQHVFRSTCVCCQKRENNSHNNRNRTISRKQNCSIVQCVRRKRSEMIFILNLSFPTLCISQPLFHRSPVSHFLNPCEQLITHLGGILHTSMSLDLVIN